MADVIGKLKKIMPELKCVYYRQDNAGCYRCGPTILHAPFAAQQHGVCLKRLDFSDPQGGKGSCDRKAATIKGHMRLHLNEGHNIEFAEDMVKAMSSRGGVPGVHVTLCEEVTVPSPFQGKIDGVSSLSNIAYEDDGMRVWKAYGIGSGKVLADKPSCSSQQLPRLTTTNCTTQDLF